MFTAIIRFCKDQVKKSLDYVKKVWDRFNEKETYKKGKPFSQHTYSFYLNPFHFKYFKHLFMTEPKEIVINVDEDTTTDCASTIRVDEKEAPSPLPRAYSPPFSPTPIFYPLFTSESHRYHHFTNSPIRFSKPNAMRIFRLAEVERIPPCHFYMQTPKSMAILVDQHELLKQYEKVFNYAKLARAFLLYCDIDLFTSYMKSEAYYKLKHLCSQKHILIGTYVVQRSDNLYIPTPSFNPKRVTAFDFHVMDSSCQDKYGSILDMVMYFTQIGIPSNRIVVPFLPDCQINLKSRNLMGYFFRDDLCSSYVRRIQGNADDIAFP